MNKICAVIAACNEEKNLGIVLKKIKKHDIDLIVVDDGSVDNTKAIAEREGAQLIRHITNEGKGKALRDGFRFALDKNYDFVITLDADGQHDTDAIPSFIKKINKSAAGIVTGNRLHYPEGMPLIRLFINRFFSKITSLICRQNIPDAACGYKIIKKEVLQSINLGSNRYDIEPELLIKSAKAGFKIESINIKCIYTGGISRIKPLQYWSDFFRLIIKEIFDICFYKHKK
jgi:glycosyltransferase involved in cell wall biosynthesis